MKEKMEDRIAYLMKFCKGTMPVGMVVYTQADFERAKLLLKKSRNPAAKMITPILDEV